MNKGDLVAVYGTLKHGHRNHRILSSCKLHSTEWVENFKMWSCGDFPAVTEENEGAIKVEVYKLNCIEQAESLDRLEGYPRLYNRKKIQLKDCRFAWIYYMEDLSEYSKNRQITSGEWHDA